MPTTIDNLLSRMTLKEKIGQMILASIEVSRMDAGTREFLRKNHIGNVILFGKNCAGRAALAQLNAEIQHTVMAENGLPALIAIDQEGGCVTRLRSEATVFPSAMVIARTGDPANAYKVGRMMGGELRALGINLDCAPVLDTLSGPAERRYYGQTVQSIADYGCAMARGLRDAGVLACGKHFPGHEQTGADTHFGFVVDNTPRDTLMNSCLTPFCRAMSEDLASVMVSHVCFPALDDTDTPCSMSAPVIQGVLRGQLGYQGLVISDGLQMHAILDQYGATAAITPTPPVKMCRPPASVPCAMLWPMESCRWRGWMNRCGGSWHASWRWAGLCPPAMPPARIGAIMLPLRMRWPKPA